MNQNKEKHVDSRLYTFFEKLWRFDTVKWKSDIQFNTSFSDVLKEQWKQIFVFTVLQTSLSIYFTYFPILMAQGIESKNLSLIYTFLGLGVMFFVLYYSGLYLQRRWLVLQQYRIGSSARKLLVEADPINHKTLSKGLVISKLGVFGQGFVALIDVFVNNIFTSLASLVSIVIIFSQYDTTLSLILTTVFLVELLLFALIRNKIIFYFKPTDIYRRDKRSKTDTVLITQKDYIRSSFQAEKMFDQFGDAYQNMFVGRRTFGMTNSLTSFTISIFQYVLIGFSVWYLFDINIPTIETLALVTALTAANQRITIVTKNLDRVYSNWLDIQDSWEFIQKNTKKTYPVID